VTKHRTAHGTALLVDANGR